MLLFDSHLIKAWFSPLYFRYVSNELAYLYLSLSFQFLVEAYYTLISSYNSFTACELLKYDLFEVQEGRVLEGGLLISGESILYKLEFIDFYVLIILNFPALADLCNSAIISPCAYIC